MENFHDLITKELFDNLNEEEISVFKTINDILKEGLSFLKSGNSEVGNIYIEKALDLINIINRDTYLYNSLLLNYYPKKALFHYNSNDLKKAFYFTSKSINQCKHYSDLCKNNFLLLFNIQQYHNIARIFFKEGKIDLYLLTCSSCLNYLFLFVEKMDLAKRHVEISVNLISLCIKFLYQIYFDILSKLLNQYKKNQNVFKFFHYLYIKLRFTRTNISEKNDELFLLLKIFKIFSFFQEKYINIFLIKATDLINQFDKEVLIESKVKIYHCLNNYINYIKLMHYESRAI